ncbi:MAG: FadR/GntR family transcriptional regulator, partial [Oscillospiraceae bacterium]
RRYGTVETLLSIMKYNGGHLRREEVRSILEIKVIVDKLAVELAVQRLTDEDLNKLRVRLQTMEQQSDLADNAAEAAFEFYHEITMISGNTLLPLIYRSFRVPVVHLWTRFVRKYGNQTVCKNAKSIYNAFEKRDMDEVVKAAEAAVTVSIIGPREIYED